MKEIVKEASIFVPKMCCTTTSRVNNMGEKVDYKQKEIEIGMAIYMDDFSLAGAPEEVKKGIRKCARMEVEKKLKYSLCKTKYRSMVVKKGQEKEVDISEQLKAGNIQRSNKYKYFRITINDEENLKGTLKK